MILAFLLRTHDDILGQGFHKPHYITCSIYLNTVPATLGLKSELHPINILSIGDVQFVHVSSPMYSSSQMKLLLSKWSYWQQPSDVGLKGIGGNVTHFAFSRRYDVDNREPEAQFHLYVYVNAVRRLSPLFVSGNRKTIINWQQAYDNCILDVCVIVDNIFHKQTWDKWVLIIPVTKYLYLIIN